MRNSIKQNANPLGDAVFNASRQVWLASLGAAAMTRDWAEAEAGTVFRTLVKEGTAVEARTIRMVGHRLEGSFVVANGFWKQARATVSNTVKHAAGTAVTLVQDNLPKALPKVTLPAMLVRKTTRKSPAKKRVASTQRTTKARAKKPVKGAKRVSRTASRK